MKFIKAYTRDRAKEMVVVTDEGDFPIWVKDFEKYFTSLQAGDEIEEPEALRTLAVRREIKKSIIRKLSAGNNTKNALIRKVMSEKMFGVYPERSDVEKIINKLVIAGFINDAMYADRFLEKALEKNWGEYKIRASMRERGFESADIDAAIKKACVNWEALAREWIEESGEEDRDTIFRKLQSRGFSTDIILNVLNGD